MNELAQERLRSIDLQSVPNHVGIIMDGNGRWANAQGQPRHVGHEAGEQALFKVLDGAINVGIEYLSIYAFSTENWRRPISEVTWIMNFNRDFLRRRGHEMHEKNVRIRFIGRKKFPVPKDLIQVMDEMETLTRDNTGLKVQIAFNYGGRAELVDGITRLANEVKEGKVNPNKVSEAMLSNYLYLPKCPDVDLMIRTSGENRTSNFLIWQAAYAELLFDERMWPDWDELCLYEAVIAFQQRHRRFGKV